MKSFKHHYFYYPFFMLLTVFFLFFSDTTVSAAVKTSDLETVPWSMVTESSIINEKGCCSPCVPRINILYVW